MPTPVRTLPTGPTQRGAGTYGQVPTVPDLFGTQAGAISGNLGNLSNLYGLTGSLNTEIAKQAQLPFQLNLPNYQGMVGQSSQNILSQLQGQVPQDVANQISQMAAERGVSTGSIGSPNANAALLRSLGLTSLGLQQQGEQNLTGAMQRTPTGQQFNPQQFLVSPQQQQEAQYFANLLGAAPTPGMGQRANLGAFQSGLGAVRGLGNSGYGGNTDALGFQVPNMGAEYYGPTPVGHAPAGSGYVNSSSSYNPWSSDITRSGGDFGASNTSMGNFNAPITGFGNTFPQTGEPWPGYSGSEWPENQFGMGWGDVGQDLYP